MFAAILGVVKLLVADEVVVNNNDPPVAAVYHLKVPDDPEEAWSVTTPAPHLEAPVTAGVDPAETMVATTASRGVVTHTPLSNST